MQSKIRGFEVALATSPMSRVVSATETEAISPNSSQMQDLDMSQVLKSHIIEERRNTAESMTEIMPSATKYDV